MGFRPGKKIYNLRFADEYDGLVVRANSATVEEFLAMQALVSSDDVENAVEATEDLLKRFAGFLVEWNVEQDDGTPVPATYEGVKKQDFAFINMIIWAWMEALASVDNPLNRGSSAGDNSLELSLGLASASQSQMS